MNYLKSPNGFCRLEEAMIESALVNIVALSST